MLREVEAHRPAVPRPGCEGLARVPDARGAGRCAGGAAEWRVAAWGEGAGGCGAVAGGGGFGGAGQRVGALDRLRILRAIELLTN
jgi:hypothetical protein